MKKEFLSIKDANNIASAQPEHTQVKEKKSEVEAPRGGISSEAKLLIVVLVLFFVALNVWGYYLYRKGFFGISANITGEVSSTPTVKNFEKSDSVYMLPGV